MKRLLGSLVAAASFGCGGPDDNPTGGGAFDCAWIASDNCWRKAARAVAACVPEQDAGVLADDATACRYDPGPTVLFDEPVLPFDSADIGVTIEQDGNECARMDRTLGQTTLRTSSGTVDVTGVFADGMERIEATFRCPDGAGYRSDDFLGTLRACEPDPSDWPGTIVEQKNPSSFGIDLAGGDGGQVTLFRCQG